MGTFRNDGIRWQASPDDNDGHSKYRIIRTPAAGALNLRVLSHRMVGARTHYWGGRTTPCSTENCKPCSENHASRWHGWLICQDTKTSEQVIVEFPPAVGTSFLRCFSQLRTLRGVRFKLFRVGGKPNGKVVIQFGGIDENKEHLPNVPDLEPILCRLWGVLTAPTRSSNRVADHVLTEQEMEGEEWKQNGHID